MTREEAINEIRSWDFLNGKEIEAVQTFIPELRESEDERIRKKLIWLLQQDICPFPDEEAKQMAAWLEKQKYDRMKSIYDARESFESALKKAWNDYHNGYENVDKLEDDYVECAHAKGFREGYLFGIEKQKEQKHPNGCFTCDEYKKGYEAGRLNGITAGYNKAMKEQKPAEWSEEDEKMIDTIVSTLGQYIDYKAVSGTGSGYATPRYSKEIDWLKSLRPSWKPNEEQMAGLLVAIGDEKERGSDVAKTLRSLYEQLKKL